MMSGGKLTAPEGMADGGGFKVRIGAVFPA